MHRATQIELAALIAALPALAPAQEQVGMAHQWGPKNVPEFEPAFENQTRAPITVSDYALRATEIVRGLSHPWAIARLPGNEGYLVTERSGNLRHLGPDGTLSEPIAGVPELFARGQGGLLDVKAGPDFAQTRMIWLTYAKPMGDGLSATAAAKARLGEDMSELTDVTDIFVQQPPSPTAKHYGSRVVFDTEGHVFVTTGEHFTEKERGNAQDLGKTYGKVVRLNADGTVPGSNPFADTAEARPEIWSLGHRNIQGAAFRPETGQLWTIEHGPQGGDELNLIEPGANYGWPAVSYGERYSGQPVGNGQSAHEANGFTEPRYYWDPVIAPGDMVFYDGAMFPEWQGNVLIAGLVAGGVVRVALDGDTAVGEERILPELGRVRDIEIAADGSLLVATDQDNGAIIRIARAGKAE